MNRALGGYTGCGRDPVATSTDRDPATVALAYREALAMITEAVLVADERGTCTDANQAAAALLRYEPAELLGRSVGPAGDHLKLQRIALLAEDIMIGQNDKLNEAGLFLKAVAANTKKLPNLIQPHLAEEVTSSGSGVRLGALMKQAPQLAPNSLEQVAALPLGARLAVEPWTSRLELLRNTNAPALSTREKLPLAIAPLMPYVRYAETSLAEAR